MTLDDRSRLLHPNHIRQPAKKVDKLYNILSDFQVKSAAFEYRNPGDGYKDIQKAKRAILDWHNKQVEEIIGEDEKTDYPAPASWVGEDAAIRNKLRAEQRQRAKRES